MAYTPPKYYIVKQAILEKIQSGELKHGEAIPSERELMLTQDVSRITVRKAVEELEQEGYLYKVQGKGTYVRGEKKKQDLFSLTSCTEDVLRQGMTPSRRVVDSSLIPAGDERGAKLQIAADDLVYRLCRVYYADGQPINYTKAYLPYILFPGIEKHDFSKQSLYKNLEEEYGVKIKRAYRTLEAVLANNEVGDLLQIHPGAPLILFKCVTIGEINKKEIPIETFNSYYRTDIFKFSIEQIR